MVRRGLSIIAVIVLLPLAGGLLQGALPSSVDLIAPALYGAPHADSVPRLLLALGLEPAPRIAE